MTPLHSALSPYKPRPWSPARPKLGDSVQNVLGRLPEMKEAGNWFLVTGAFTAGDLLIHELFPNVKGDKTPPAYFGNKLIWTIPSLLVGRLISDYIVKGSTPVRALTIGTVANAMLAVRYLKAATPDYLLTVGLIHEVLLVGLSFLITGPSPVTGFYGEAA